MYIPAFEYDTVKNFISKYPCPEGLKPSVLRRAKKLYINSTLYRGGNRLDEINKGRYKKYKTFLDSRLKGLVDCLRDSYIRGWNRGFEERIDTYLSTIEDEKGVQHCMRIDAGAEDSIFIELTDNQKALIRNHLKRGES